VTGKTAEPLDRSVLTADKVGPLIGKAHGYLAMLTWATGRYSAGRDVSAGTIVKGLEGLHNTTEALTELLYEATGGEDKDGEGAAE
jgi:hypothetical protein